MSDTEALRARLEAFVAVLLANKIRPDVVREAIAALTPPAEVYGDTRNTFRALSDAEMDEMNARLREAMPPIMRQTHPPADRAAAAPAPEGLADLQERGFNALENPHTSRLELLQLIEDLDAALRARPATLSDDRCLVCKNALVVQGVAVCKFCYADKSAAALSDETLLELAKAWLAHPVKISRSLDLVKFARAVLARQQEP